MSEPDGEGVLQSDGAVEPVSGLAHLYTVLADVLRDQVSTQPETADTNDLKSLGLLGAAVAIVVALLLLRATGSSGIGSWWWYPLPGFILSGVLAAVPLRPPSDRRHFLGGPDVPKLLQSFEQVPVALGDQLQVLLVRLAKSWDRNDELLAQEGRALTWGGGLLGIAVIITVGLYAWGLT